MNVFMGLRTLQRCLSRRCGSQLIRRPSAIGRLHGWHGARETPILLQHLHTGSWNYRRAAAASQSSDAPRVIEEGYEEIEVELPAECPGCGVRLQQENPNGPGYFQVPKRVIDMLSNPEEPEGEDIDDEEEEGGKGEWESFDSLVEGWLESSSPRGGRPPRPQAKAFADQEQDLDIVSEIMCARCFSLRNYGRIKNTDAEAAMPEFDVARLVGRRVSLQKFRRSIVLVVVDLADFDGSLPRTAVRALMPPDMRDADVSQQFPPGFRMVIAANKADLLPTKATQTRVESWVRRRMAQGGLPRPSAVHVVSSEKGTGVRGLLADLQAAVGSRGDVWVIGAQNAGKSSLINAMRQSVGLRGGLQVTAAPLPGTTLGVVPVPSLLPKGCKMLDTPGVPHSYQLSAFMTADEMRMLLPRRSLKPRTFRIGPGSSVSIGAVARLDVVDAPGATIYLTVWVSDQVVCHFGKTEGAEERYAKHAGTKLTPPVAAVEEEGGEGGEGQGGEARMKEFPALRPAMVEVTGDGWKESSMDVAIAGLGWVGIGLAGKATLRVWAPPGVAVTTRDALLPDMAKDLERPGFGLAAPKAAVGGRKGGSGGGKKRR